MGLWRAVRAVLAGGLASGFVCAAPAAWPRESAAGPGAPASVDAAGLGERLDATLRHAGLRGARVAALVVRRDDGAVLYARDPDRALIPASNQKVLTALAALSAFGPAHRFTTEVWADAAPDAEGAVERLYLRGGGDPALTSEELWRLAADLRRLGLREVRGGIGLDATLFDAQLWHPSWGRISARAYHAPVAALTVNYGAFAVQVVPGATPGAPLSAVLDPPVPYLRLANRGATGPPGSHPTVVVDRRPAGAGEEVLVVGRSAAGGEGEVFHRSVLDPVRYAGSVARLQLEANGIRVAGPIGRAKVPASAVLLHEFRGRSLAEIVRLFVKYSNNAIAEGLVKALAARADDGPAGWVDGIAAMRSELAGLGLDLSGAEFVDGSGLSYANHVSPRTYVDALRLGERSFRFGAEFVSALPIAGADGTLRERAEGAAWHVRAKTGSLTRVTGLSGFAELPGGERAVFSILANGYRQGAVAAMAGVDAFVAALVAAPDAP